MHVLRRNLPQDVPLTKVVALYPVGLRLGLNKHLGRDQLRVGLPVVGKIHRHVQPLQAVEHPPQRGGAPVPALPVDKLAGIAILDGVVQNVQYIHAKHIDKIGFRSHENGLRHLKLLYRGNTPSISKPCFF